MPKSAGTRLRRAIAHTAIAISSAAASQARSMTVLVCVTDSGSRLVTSSTPSAV